VRSSACAPAQGELVGSPLIAEPSPLLPTRAGRTAQQGGVCSRGVSPARAGRTGRLHDGKAKNQLSALTCTGNPAYIATFRVLCYPPSSPPARGELGRCLLRAPAGALLPTRAERTGSPHPRSEPRSSPAHPRGRTETGSGAARPRMRPPPTRARQTGSPRAPDAGARGTAHPFCS